MLVEMRLMERVCIYFHDLHRQIVVRLRSVHACPCNGAHKLDGDIHLQYVLMTGSLMTCLALLLLS